MLLNSIANWSPKVRKVSKVRKQNLVLKPKKFYTYNVKPGLFLQAGLLFLITWCNQATNFIPCCIANIKVSAQRAVVYYPATHRSVEGCVRHLFENTPGG